MKAIVFLFFLTGMVLPANGQVVSARTAPINLKVTAGSLRTADINRGKYHALIIGIQNYQASSLKTLGMPVVNANSFKDVLIKHYNFTPERVKVLNNPTKKQILAQLKSYIDRLSLEDNLLIFYAGHGMIWDKNQQGYWLPADAVPNDQATWISNGELRDNLRGIETKHTLIIADACFSGSILGIDRDPMDATRRSAQIMYRPNSRRALTSGALTTVPDKSVFLEYLIKYLEANREKYLPAESLYLGIKGNVANNSPQRQNPQFGIIQQTGDQGGSFIFIRK
jgi:hypothetical protein